MASLPARAQEADLCDAQLEIQLLGSLLLDPAQLPVVADSVDAGDFSLEPHAQIYRTLVEESARTAGGLVDLTLLAGALHRQGLLETVGGSGYLLGMANSVPVALFAPEYAARLHDLGTLRRYVAAGIKLMSAAHAPGATPESVAETADQLLREAEAPAGGPSALGARDSLALAPQMVTKYLDWVETQGERNQAGDGVTGVPTGLGRLDRHTGGWQPGNLIVLAASTGTGKTAAATTFSYHALRAGKRVAYFSLEMTHVEMIGRFLLMETGLPDKRIRTGALSEEEWQRLIDGAAVISEFRLAVDQSAGLTPAQLRRTCKRARERLGGLDLIVVDYFQLMSMGEHASRAAQSSQVVELQDISRMLKETARLFDVPLIVLAQISTAINLRTNPEPTLGDIRSCKALVDDADLTLLLHRPELYDPETERKGQADLILAKGRNLELTRWTLYFNGPLMLFTEIAHRSDFEPAGEVAGWEEDAVPLPARPPTPLSRPAAAG